MKTLAALIGRQAAYRVGGMTFTVTVTDVRSRYGNVDVEITPVHGAGYQWVQLTSVEIGHLPPVTGKAGA
jgi:hypothetical protein